MRTYWDGMIDGCAATGVVALLASFAFVELGWKEHENLTSGIAAVIAAVATVWIINRQIVASRTATADQMKQTAEIEAQRRRAKNLSQRAALPAALSSLTDYILGQAEVWKRVYNEDHPRDYPKGTTVPSARKANPDDVRILIDCIEFADGSAIDALAALVEQLQIHESRCSSQDRAEMVTQSDLLNRIVETIDLHARIYSLFPYARRTSDGPLPLEILESGRFLGFEAEIYPKLYGAIDMLFPNASNSPNSIRRKLLSEKLSRR